MVDVIDLAKYIIIYSLTDRRCGVSYVTLNRILFTLQYIFSRKYNFPLFFSCFEKSCYNIHEKRIEKRFGYYGTNTIILINEKLPELKLSDKDINIINDIIEDVCESKIISDNIAHKIVASEVWKPNKRLTWREIRKRDILDNEI
jgi:hypothetical protein